MSVKKATGRRILRGRRRRRRLNVERPIRIKWFSPRPRNGPSNSLSFFPPWIKRSSKLKEKPYPSWKYSQCFHLMFWYEYWEEIWVWNLRFTKSCEHKFRMRSSNSPNYALYLFYFGWLIRLAVLTNTFLLEKLCVFFDWCYVAIFPFLEQPYLPTSNLICLATSNPPFSFPLTISEVWYRCNLVYRRFLSSKRPVAMESSCVDDAQALVNATVLYQTESRIPPQIWPPLLALLFWNYSLIPLWPK